ncbi:hypothetical protein FRAHR75_1160019 [Frankia sp. Hr75.2]|nr:hypothetical protein FRAHR75_1160019 [Frankia sp. Hr75.2]
MHDELRELAARLAQRIDLFATDQDPAHELSDNAMQEFEQFRALVVAGNFEPDLLRLATIFHWCHYLTLPEGMDAADLSWAGSCSR